MKLCITGTPGTGKTTISKKLTERLGWKLISVNDLAEELNAYLGEDTERKAKILDMDKINDYLANVEEDVIVEGHTTHEVDCDVVSVLRCNPDVLEKRLKERYPNKPEKVEENLDAEILGVITSEAVEKSDQVYEVVTTRGDVGYIVDEIIGIIDGNTEGYGVGKIDWLEKYEERLI